MKIREKDLIIENTKAMNKLHRLKSDLDKANKEVEKS